MLETFDHITIAVQALDAAIADYTRLLGQSPCSRCSHPDLGTEAAVFALQNASVELLAPKPGAPEAEGLRQHLARHGQGLLAIALGTTDADVTRTQLRERGARAAPPMPGRAAELDGEVRHYRTVELSPRETRGLQVFVVERADLQALRASQPPPKDALHALDHVVVTTSDADAAITLYGERLGIRLALDRELAGRRMLFFRIGGVTLEVVVDPALGARDQFYGAAYRVRDEAAAHARLVASGVEVSALRQGRKPDTKVFTVRAGTAGVPTLILSDPSRS